MDAHLDSPAPVNLQTDFEDIHLRAEHNWSFVQALRECFTVGSQSMEAALVPYLDDSIRGTMGEAFPKMGLSDATHQRLLKDMASNKVTSARSLMDAAAIVVVQATLDSAVNEYLVLLARFDPKIWEPEVSDEPLPLKAAKDKSYEELLQSKAMSFAKALSAKSLSKKVQLILDRCYRGDIELSPSAFRFDVPRVKAFDDLRHDIAHGRAMGILVEDMDGLLLFLWQTLLSLQDVVGAHLGVKFNPARHFEEKAETPPRILKL